MKLRFAQNNIRYGYNGRENAIAGNPPSFKGKNLQYTQAQIEKIAQNVDDVLGSDKFFSSKMAQAGIKPQDGVITIKDEGLLKSIFKTVKYPFVDMPLDIANSILNKAKNSPFKNTAQKLSDASILQKRAQKREEEKSFRLVQDLLTRYFPSGDNLDLNKAGENFKNKVTSGINETVKNYSSRDERTLNRAVTSTVSAVYSGRDFYNISMLQKDDSQEAKKAEKSRFKQEMTRMAFSAGMTFLTLGALDKYVKTNIFANAVVIAFSALISEVGSRLLSHTPLHPLSCEEAKKIAQKKKTKDPETAQKADQKPEQQKIKKNNENISFKSNQNDIFRQFAKQDGSLTPLNIINSKSASDDDFDDKDDDDDDKKSHSLIFKLALAAGGASAFYLLTKGVKGEFGAKIARKNLLSAHEAEISDYLSGKTSTLSPEILNSIQEISNKQNNSAKKFGISEKIKKFTTTRKQEIDLNNLKQNILAVKNSEEGAEISKLLDKYLEHIDSVSKNGSKITASVDLPVLPGVYDGVTKIFKTVYQILSIPGAALNGLVNKTIFANSEETFSKICKKTDSLQAGELNKSYKKEAASLAKLIKKYRNANDKNRKIVNQIKKATRNFEAGAETGELANLSRTMVTAISTYFFVNDYSNKVLIESAGKDVNKAREERNDRIAHKLSNFVINGTLMNLFNSVFKTQLNNSLPQAALIAGATEVTNEFLVRKSICQPVGRKKSKQDIIDYEQAQINRKGLMGSWSRLFRKMTGKKTLTQKAGIDNAHQDKK